MKYLIVFFLVMIYKIGFSQSTDDRVYKISTIKKHIEQYKNNSDSFIIVEKDGGSPMTTSTKKILGIFKKTTCTSFGGSYAETDFWKDSTLVSVRIWSRDYLNSQRDLSSVSYSEYIFENDSLCYYYESKSLAKKGGKDSLIYKVEYFLQHEETIKKNIEGKLAEDADTYLRGIIKYTHLNLL
jgi:hypothetical protein